jgi:hypothetical protein
MTITEEDITLYIKNARLAPRVNELMEDFSHLAMGNKGVPFKSVVLNSTLLSNDERCLHFSKIRSKYAGIFNQHFVASIPYILEEQCRFGAAVVDYANHIKMNYGRCCNIYTLGDGPGVMARSFSDYSGGDIRTLTCSPNPENLKEFSSNKPNQSTHFYLGPFFDVSREELIKRNFLSIESGFDMIIEDTTFQMYGKSRLIPTYLASRNLKKDGLFVFLEKFSHANEGQFKAREKQKDETFKSCFFSREQIEEKKVSIINNMNQHLVTIEEMTEVLSKLFRAAVIVWNSGNFSTIVASNNQENLKKFISFMIPPAIPNEFSYIKSPQVILGKNISVRFR